MDISRSLFTYFYDSSNSNKIFSVNNSILFRLILNKKIYTESKTNLLFESLERISLYNIKVGCSQNLIP